MTVLSDDRIIIRYTDENLYAYGTPWHGDAGASNPNRMGIEGIFFLEHSKKNYLKPLTRMDAATRMFVRSFLTFWDKDGMKSSLELINKIIEKTPCYELGFVPEKSAVEFLRRL